MAARVGTLDPLFELLARPQWTLRRAPASLTGAGISAALLTLAFPLPTAASALALLHAISAPLGRLITGESLGALLQPSTARAVPCAILCLLAPYQLPPPAAVAACALLGICNYAVLVAIPRPRALPAPGEALSPNEQPLSGQVVVLTGSSAGIGLISATQLLQLGATVVFACRSRHRAEAAISVALRAASAPADRAAFVCLDVADVESVRRFAADFAAAFTRCDALVCNAGCMQPERQQSLQGNEAMLATNHLGHFLLMKLLLPRLRESAGRVVFVASCLHRGWGGIGVRQLAESLLQDPNSERRYEMFTVYGKSKLAMIATALELHRREAESGIVSIALHPGTADTEISRDFPAAIRWANSLCQPLLRTIFPSAAQAAYTTTFAVLCRARDVFGGKYLERCAVEALSPVLLDPAFTEGVWRLSEAMLGSANAVVYTAPQSTTASPRQPPGKSLHAKAPAA